MSQEEKNETQETPNPSSPKRPMFSIIGWALILIILPITFIMLKGNEDGGFLGKKTIKLTQSSFENSLIEGKIKKVRMESRDNHVGDTIRGLYTQIDGQPDVPFITTIVYSESLDNIIRTKCSDVEVIRKSSTLISMLFQILMMVVVLGVIYFFISKQMRRGGNPFEFGKSKARLSMPGQNKVTFDDVCGVDEAKQEVKEIVDYLKNPLKYQQIGAKIPRGVLLAGSPGTGKTLLARAIAGEASVPFFSISGSDFLEMFVGVGASRVRDMFEEAHRNAPCLIFIDEIDAIGRARASVSSMSGGHDEREQTLNSLLVQMDGFEQDSGVIVLAATNRPEVLDPALLRPGRFDRRVTIDLPDVNGRTDILKVHIAKVAIDEKINLRAIAKITVGFSGAELASLINEAALLAASSDRTKVEQLDLEEARDKVCWGKERKSLKLDEKERRLTAYHEAGHAIVGIHCSSLPPLHKVTIIPRGNAMGMTMSMAEQDSYSHTATEMKETMSFAFGGRIAEQLIFGDITGGAAQDIRQVTRIAKMMVCDLGMSAKIGPIKYISSSQAMYDQSSAQVSQEYSEETGKEIDSEIRALIDEAYNKATKILEENKDQLDKLALALLENETMSAMEIYELLELSDKIDEIKAKQEKEEIYLKEELEKKKKEKEIKEKLEEINIDDLIKEVEQKTKEEIPEDKNI